MKCNWRDIFQCTTVAFYADHIPNYSDPILGYSRLMPNYSDLTSGYRRHILIPHSAKRVLDCRQNHHGCRQNKLRLLWNALLTTPYVNEHYKHMFLVARDLYEMLVLSRAVVLKLFLIAYRLWPPNWHHVPPCSRKSQCAKYHSIKSLENQNWHMQRKQNGCEKF